MELLIPLQALGTFATLILLYYLCRPKSNGREAPAPSGGLPIIGHLHLLRGPKSLRQTLGAMADKYGPAIMLKLGVHRTLFVSSRELVKECFFANDRVFATRPEFAAGKYLGFHYAAFGFSPYGPYWREMRKIATLELLSKSRINKLRHLRTTELDISIKELYLLWANNDNDGLPIKVDMKQWLEHITLNVLTKMIAGKRYCGNTDAGFEIEAQRFRKTVAQIMHLGGVPVVSDALPYLEWFDFGGIVGAMKSVSKEIDSVVGNWVDEHRHKNHKIPSQDETQLDFTDVMLSSICEDNLMSNYDRDTIIKSTITQLIVAGSDTTAITMTWALSLLLNHPHVLKRAQDELDIHVGKDRHVEDSDVKNLVYLQAIVKETMRLYPPTPFGVPHEAMEDCEVGGYLIPKGTRLSPNIWKLHRDPSVWLDPTEFKPERFLTKHVHVDVRGQQFEYIPFGSGIRACPGITLAMHILHFTLARLLQAFNVETPSQEPVDMTEGSGLSMPKLTPVDTLLTPRLLSKLYKF